MKFNFEIKYKKHKDGTFGMYYIGSVKDSPFISFAKSKDECTKQTFDMIAGFIEAFPKDYKKHLKKYGVLK